MERISWKILVVALFATVVQGWKDKDKIRLQTDVQAITLHKGEMTNGRRSSPVPQVKCVGGTAGCNAFVPKVVQCYNRGSDGYDVQWECKAEMNNKYRFGKVAVNCEGYDHPDDPYILKGSCGVEFTIDHLSDKSLYGDFLEFLGVLCGKSGWMISFIMWCGLAIIGYFIYEIYRNRHSIFEWYISQLKSLYSGTGSSSGGSKLGSMPGLSSGASLSGPGTIMTSGYGGTIRR